MKKKILLMLTMIFVLSCLFVVTASAAVTTYDDAPARTNIIVSTDDLVVFDDGFTCPSAYIFKDQANIPNGNHSTPGLSHVLDFKYINGKTGVTYGIDNIVELDIPEGITTIGTFLAYNRKSLKKITIPYSVTFLGGVSFQNCSNLEECVFEKGGNPAITTIESYLFSNCTSLKAFSMPDSVTKIVGQTQFANCPNLGAVYLSKSLATIECSGQQNATFDACEKLYFVNKPFTTSDTAEPKPTIYYFPKNLSTIANQCVFRSCKSLNDVLVFGEGTVNVPNNYTFQHSPKNTVVFLGNMEYVDATYWGTTTLVFANKADKSASDIATLKGSQKKIFCNADGNKEHFAEKTVDVPAQCEINAGKYTYCFCGHEMSRNAVDGTALEHNLNYINGGATLISVTYADLSKDGIRVVKCPLCNAEKETKADKVYDYKGYSKNEKGGFCMGYLVNQEALKDYEAKNGKVAYGFVASANNNAPLNADGTTKDNVVKADLSGSGYTSVDFILTADNWEAENVASAKITLNMYIIVNNAVKYITANGYSDTAEAYKYSDIQ